MMKLLADFFPILLFFIAYKLWGIYAATFVAIAVAFLQLIYTGIRYRRVENLQLVTLVLLVVLGGATIWLHNELFIKWKPTILYWLFGILFLSSEFLGNKLLIQRLMGAQVNLPKAIWARLNRSWVFFFTVMGLVNLYVVYHFDTDVWVNFKLFGMLGLTLLFVIAQAVYLVKHAKIE
jgi:intracellular septation protein